MKLISLARSGSRGTRADLGIGVKIRPTNRSRASARSDPKAHVLSQKAVWGEPDGCKSGMATCEPRGDSQAYAGLVLSPTEFGHFLLTQRGKCRDALGQAVRRLVSRLGLSALCQSDRSATSGQAVRRSDYHCWRAVERSEERRVGKECRSRWS